MIMVYDVNVKRVAKVLKTSRRYLLWVQNSVFEGDITQGKLNALKSELSSIINNAEDSVIFYVCPNKHSTQRECIGMNKEFIDDFGLI